jgi:hypothetical protein
MRARDFHYHRPKLEFVRTGTLDDKRSGDTRFAGLANFLESIPTTCPHDLFRRDDDPKARASQATPAWADVSTNRSTAKYFLARCSLTEVERRKTPT